jgi:Ca2+-binding RTX toxin-like protein
MNILGSLTGISSFHRPRCARKATRRLARNRLRSGRLWTERLEDRQLLAALVGYSLEITNSLGQPATQIAAGQTFNLNVYTEDLRGPGEDRGVGGAYVDVVYTNSSLVSMPGSRVFSDDYPDIRKQGDAFTGKLNNAGATNFGISETVGAGRKLIFSAPFTALAGGSVTFQTTHPTADADPGPGDDDFMVYNTILQEPPQTVMSADIDFGQVTLNIVSVGADAGGPYSVNEQGSVQLSGTGFVASGFTVQSYEWDLDGDGQFGEAGATPRGNERAQNPTFLAGGLDGFAGATFEVKLRVVGRRTSDGQLITSDPDSATINIVNVGPTVAINSANTTLAATGQPVTFVFSATDVAPADQAAPFTYEINWGDGQIQQLSGPATNASFTHYYDIAGNFQVSVKAIDNDDGAGPSVNFGSLIEVFAQRVINGDLIVGGTSADERIEIRQRADGKLYALYNRVGSDPVISPNFTVPGMVVIYAGPGSDDVVHLLSSTRNTRTFGGPGNDAIVGSNGPDEMHGEDGRDALFGRQNADVLRGGPGDDKLFGDRGSDSVYGDAGNDTLRGGNDLSADLDLVFGGDGRDYMPDEAGPEVLLGGAGDDRIGGQLGRNIVIGGTGRDIVSGGPVSDAPAGNHGGVVIGETTIHDNNEVALRALLAEWASSASFADRVNHLLGGSGGLNGSTFLRKNTEVTNDGVRDVLIGGDHSDLFYQFPVNFFGPGDPGPEDQVV